MKKTKYTWYPENADHFNDTYDSIEEAISMAQACYDNHEEEYEDGTEFNSPIITLAVVEEYDIEKTLSSIIDDIPDRLEEFIAEEMGLAADEPVDVFIGLQHEETFKTEMLEFLKQKVEQYVSIYPRLRGNALADSYDLEQRQWVRFDKAEL